MSRRTRFAVCLVAGAFAAGCSGPTLVDPTLTLTIRNPIIQDDGEDIDVQVMATDAFGKPGRVEVTVSADHGTFSNGDPSIALILDSAGSAFTTFSCDARKDPDCFGAITIRAEWNYRPTEKGAKPDNLQASRRVTVVGCGVADGGSPTIRRRCANPTFDECDGLTDLSLTGAGVTLLNGIGGNGYDDDCDGLADEGCRCDAKGETKECWLTPATQRDPATGLPAGWCASNSKGSLDCGGSGTPQWSGLCRGAQPPAEHDTCSAGDFNCDGLERNNDVQGCRCAVEVVCPTAPLVLAPYPDPKNLTPIDARAWLPDAGLIAQTRGWRWTAIGGDCDNVLPNPTFQLYRGKDTTVASNRVGVKQTVYYDTSFNPARYLADPTSKVQAMRTDAGDGLAGAIIYPAFSLSGDYIVQGEFDYGTAHYSCTQKVQVRAPGIRAELCWDSVGKDDVDLHLARLQGTTCSTHGWNRVCSADGGDDCYYANTRPDWGYPPSPDAACKGWGSKQTSTCNNPRLDLDNISCNVAATDPSGAGFCSPENINLDLPNDGETFAVGVNYYKATSNPPTAHPHVNLYCNGQRVLSAGYNPVTGQTAFPALKTQGSDLGDFWTVATITARVDAGTLVACDVMTIPSRHADLPRDGSGPDGGGDYCVDSPANSSPAPWTAPITSAAFIGAGSAQVGDAGTIPTTRADWCRH